jgi:hypothetical protein
MITPKEDELWQDSNGNKYMPFLNGGKISFVGKFGNFWEFDIVVHGVNGWERVFPEVNDGE